jgi:hypothetical protein
MGLSEEEKDLFYELWFSVLAHTNRQLRVVPGITQPKDVLDKPKEHLAKIRDALLAHPKLLESFVSENPKLTPEKQAIVLGWRGWIPGEFCDTLAKALCRPDDHQRACASLRRRATQKLI